MRLTKKTRVSIRLVSLAVLALLLIACGAASPASGVSTSPQTASTTAPTSPAPTESVSLPAVITSASTPDTSAPTPTTSAPTPTRSAPTPDTACPPTVEPPAATPAPVPTIEPAPRPTVVSTPPVMGYRVLNTYPHDPGAFTQGLVYEDGVLYEGTGLNGQSTLRRVALETGEVLQSCALPPELFGEGIAVYGERIIQITWQSHIGLVYDKASFELLGTFSYPTEGWGLTHDEARLIMSDGSATLHFLDPETFTEVGRVEVYDENGPVVRLNELEYIGGEVYANIWQTDRIARIDPQTGQVLGWVDLSGLLGPEDRTQPVDVLNGIAYDPASDRLFVTGKLWPKLFEIELVAPPT